MQGAAQLFESVIAGQAQIIQSVIFNQALMHRYSKPVPLYTTFPSTAYFHDFDENQYRRVIAESNGGHPPGPLSLNINIPFCRDGEIVYTRDNVIPHVSGKDTTERYLNTLLEEIRMQGALIDGMRAVDKLHVGGGMPTVFSGEQMFELMTVLSENFSVLTDDSGEYTIETDPRNLDRHGIFMLRKLGFNNICLDFQEYIPGTKDTIDSKRTLVKCQEVFEAARDARFNSISINLVYGLPGQTAESVEHILSRVLELGPERIIFNDCRLLPHWQFPRQKFDKSRYPSEDDKNRMLLTAILRLTEAGYVYIGLEQYVLPDDKLAIGQQDGKLSGNVQGNSAKSNSTLLGLGISSIGFVSNVYSQNRDTIEDYCSEIESGCLPVCRGYILDFDDQLRAEIINLLICNYYIYIPVVEDNHNICFNRYFSAEIQELQRMQDDKLLEITGEHIKVFPAGKVFIRNICTVFDKFREP